MQRTELEKLTQRNARRRKLINNIFITFTGLCTIIAIIPLGSILFEVIKNGYPAISWEFLTSRPGPIGSEGGGIGNAIQGTMILIGLTSLLGVPFGVVSGIYLAEFGESKLANFIRIMNDMLTEFPSIVVGIFAYYLVTIFLVGSFSVFAGAFALAVIMLPVVARTTEESLRLVPNSLRESAAALGIRKWRYTWSIVISAARRGMINGIMLSVARITGETAPLIMTILGSQWFFSSFFGPMDALPLRIWRLSLLPYDYARVQGWGAALVLISIVLTLNIIVKFLTRSKVRT
jgi:phosphate transport system permease protein